MNPKNKTFIEGVKQ